VQLSTGDMLRAAVKAERRRTKVKDIMDRGDLCPDELVVAIVGDRIEEPDARNGFILDGSRARSRRPRRLNACCARSTWNSTASSNLKVRPSALLRRIENRVAK